MHYAGDTLTALDCPTIANFIAATMGCCLPSAASATSAPAATSRNRFVPTSSEDEASTTAFAAAPSATAAVDERDSVQR